MRKPNRKTWAVFVVAAGLGAGALSFGVPVCGGGEVSDWSGESSNGPGGGGTIPPIGSQRCVLGEARCSVLGNGAPCTANAQCSQARCVADGSGPHCSQESGSGRRCTHHSHCTEKRCQPVRDEDGRQVGVMCVQGGSGQPCDQDTDAQCTNAGCNPDTYTCEFGQPWDGCEDSVGVGNPCQPETSLGRCRITGSHWEAGCWSADSEDGRLCTGRGDEECATKYCDENQPGLCLYGAQGDVPCNDSGDCKPRCTPDLECIPGGTGAECETADDCEGSGACMLIDGAWECRQGARVDPDGGQGYRRCTHVSDCMPRCNDRTGTCETVADEDFPYRTRGRAVCSPDPDEDEDVIEADGSAGSDGIDDRCQQTYCDDNSCQRGGSGQRCTGDDHCVPTRCHYYRQTGTYQCKRSEHGSGGAPCRSTIDCTRTGMGCTRLGRCEIGGLGTSCSEDATCDGAGAARCFDGQCGRWPRVDSDSAFCDYDVLNPLRSDLQCVDGNGAFCQFTRETEDGPLVGSCETQYFSGEPPGFPCDDDDDCTAPLSGTNRCKRRSANADWFECAEFDENGEDADLFTDVACDDTLFPDRCRVRVCKNSSCQLADDDDLFDGFTRQCSGDDDCNYSSGNGPWYVCKQNPVHTDHRGSYSGPGTGLAEYERDDMSGRHRHSLPDGTFTDWDWSDGRNHNHRYPDGNFTRDPSFTWEMICDEDYSQGWSTCEENNQGNVDLCFAYRCDGGGCERQPNEFGTDRPLGGQVCDPNLPVDARCYYRGCRSEVCDFIPVHFPRLGRPDRCTTNRDCRVDEEVACADGCDDGDLCTTDTCDTFTGLCSNEPVFCTAAGQTCRDGSCQPACASLDCDDGDACTLDACDSTTGACMSVSMECGPSATCQNGGCQPSDPGDWTGGPNTSQ